MQINTCAKKCLKQIYKPDYKYKKVGIMLLDLVSNTYTQTSLLTSPIQEAKNAQLMKAIDSINMKMGKDSLFLASQGIERSWQMKSAMRSPNYTGDWNQLFLVK